MGVADDTGLLDGAVHVVIREAELVGQVLDLVGRTLEVVVDHSVASRGPAP